MGVPSANQEALCLQTGNLSLISTVADPSATSTNGPAARPAGFHQVALLSEATATKAPPIPSARLPTSSTTCADTGLGAPPMHNHAVTHHTARSVCGLKNRLCFKRRTLIVSGV